MIIDNIILNTELYDILVELRTQLALQGLTYFKDIKESGDNIMTQCPYHRGGQERKPSGGFRKDTGIFHCFTCGETHTLPEVISYCFSKNDLGVFGRTWLLKNFAVIEVENRKDIKLDFSRNNRTSANGTNLEQKQFVSEEELDSYRYYHSYWKKRGIVSDWIIDLFDLGYSIDDNCITFPIHDENGNCTFVARRSTVIKYFNYPSNAEKSLYGIWELKQLKEYPKEIIVCESMLDALKCWEFGKYAVAMNGLGSSLIYKQLNNLPCRKLILATDMDEAGRKARKTLRKMIKGKIITEYIWDINKAKDVGDMDFEFFSNLEEIF